MIQQDIFSGQTLAGQLTIMPMEWSTINSRQVLKDNLHGA